MNTLLNKIEDNQKIKYAFWSILILIVFSLIIYAYLIDKTVFNIVARQNNSAELAVLNSKISELESQHIQLQNAISPDFAKTLGFNDVVSPEYISMANNGQGLSLNTLR
jgi:hypothetical protein